MAIILNNQNLFDISIQQFGTIEAVFDVAAAVGATITDVLPVGTEVLVEDSESTDKAVQLYYLKNNIKPATNAPDIQGEAEKLRGIGYWAIENGFKVS